MVRGRPIGSLKVVQHKPAPVPVPSPIINPETGQVVGIYDGLCLKCQCSLYARRNWNGSIFPRLKVLLRRKDLEDNKFDKALTIEHVESGVAFLCLLHYTGDKVENKRYFLTHYKMPEDVRIARKKQGGKPEVVIPIYKPALRRPRNVPVSGNADSGSNTSGSVKTRLLVENILELESELGQAKDVECSSKKRKRLSTQFLRDSVESTSAHDEICPATRTPSDDEIQGRSDCIMTMETNQMKMPTQSTSFQTLDLSLASRSSNQSVKPEPASDASLWKLPDIEYLESFQSSFHANKKDYVVKQEVFSPPNAKKSRREETRYSEAESSRETSMSEDAISHSELMQEQGNEADLSHPALDSRIKNATQRDNSNQSCSDQSQTKIRELEELNTSLKDLLRESLRRLRDAEEINTRLEGQIRKFKQEAEAQKGLLMCLTNESESYKLRFGQVEQANRALLAELEAKAAVIESNIEQIKIVEEFNKSTPERQVSRSEDKEREIEHLHSLLEVLQSRLSSSEGIIKDLDFANEDLNRQLRAFKNKISFEESLKDELEECRDRLRQQEEKIDELKYSKSNDDDLDSQNRSLNALVELRDEMMREGGIRANDLISDLQVKEEILAWWTEMSRSRRTFEEKVLLRESEIQSLREKLVLLENRSSEKDTTMKELEVELKFKKEALDSNNKMWSDLLTGQARQSGVRALEFDLAVKENAELKEKLEKANQEILALKNVKDEDSKNLSSSLVENVDINVKEEGMDRLKRHLRRISSFPVQDQPECNGETWKRFPDV